MTVDPPYQFEIFNGNYVDAGRPLFDGNNRGLRYGDGLYETMKVVDKKPLFLDAHFARLMQSLQLLELQPGETFDLAFLGNMISLLLQKNNVSTARMRLIMYRDAGGYHQPLNSIVSWHLSCAGNCSSRYETNPRGLRLGVYIDDFKSHGILSNIKSLNGLLFVHAGTVAKKQGFDEMIICNAMGNYIEAISSNLFLVLPDAIITPPLSEGCLAGISRKQLVAFKSTSGKPLVEKIINGRDLQNATEAFLTNVIQGAQWISAIGNKTFGSGEMAAEINDYLNHLTSH